MEVAVIGAGVVGLACAAAISRRGHHVVVLERHRRIGQETSSRSSGVIHAGIYYPTGSLKARLCVQGRGALYERCQRLGIEHRKTQKLIVAPSADEVPRLETLLALGRANGAGHLELFDALTLMGLEPRVQGYAALFSPETGIIDAHGLMLSYQAEAERHGAEVALATELTAIEMTSRGYRLETRSSDAEAFALECDAVVNAAGLASDQVAAMAGLDVDARGWKLHPCKGDYFALGGKVARPTERLVYPMPHGDALGVHVTMDLGGRYRLGPDSEYVDAPRYDVDPKKAEAFAAAVRPYLPEVTSTDLSPDYAGVRPKLAGPGDTAFRDFVIAHEPQGFIQLVGIDSPGLTASSAIADEVVRQLTSP